MSFTFFSFQHIVMILEVTRAYMNTVRDDR